MALYLGLDASTQSLTAMVIEVEGPTRRLVFETSLGFERDLPEYGTRGGVLRDPDPLVAEAPPLMWAEALDRVMGAVAASGIDLSSIRAVSGSAQQHGSVYLNAEWAPALAGLDARRPLAGALDGVFARARSPIWMDSSTAAQAAAIERELGGAAALARLTGSRAFERFTGPQIRGFHERDPRGYLATARIHLVSSYLASLLAGADAPVDRGDGSGTNLMDLSRGVWAPGALAAAAPDLARRLPPIVPSWTVVGALSSYWVDRYGYPRARVVAWSGDNPCSLIGTGCVRPGTIAVSLGTSDTIFGCLDAPRVDPSGAAHVFAAPTGGWMSLICFKNGARARERVRDAHALGWGEFERALGAAPPGNRGAMMLPWFEPEITPAVRTPFARTFGLDLSNAAAHVRAVVEGQMLAMATHAGWMGGTIARIHATGGASASRAILQVMADVFGAEVLQLDARNSACLGAALRAYHADRAASGETVPWDEVVAGFAEPARGSRVAPVAAHARIYEDMKTIYAQREAEALGRA